MKFLSSVLLLFLVLPVQAKLEKNWIHVQDGSYAYCNNKSDVFKHRHQAYSIQNESLSINDNAIKLDLDLAFFQCIKNDNDNFTFLSVSPFDEFTFQNLSFTAGVVTVTVNTNWIEAVIYRDGVYRPLVHVKLDRDLKISGDFEVSEVLTDDEMDKLNNGEKVIASFDFMINRLISSDVETNDSAMKKILHYGSFRRWFSVEQGVDGLSIKRINK